MTGVMCVRDSIVKSMQLVRSGSVRKFFTLSSLVQNASFSKGWLHLAVQCFFAVITVVSFILIVMMAIPKYPAIQPVPQHESRCYSKNCIVYCNGVPYFGQYYEDIVYTVSELPNFCTGFYLILRNGMFINQTLQTKHFPRMRLPVYELAFTGGNLNHLPTEAFLNQYASTIKTLLFYRLVIKSWTADSLVGLSSLESIYIMETLMSNIQPYVLRPVDDTLQTLTITSSNHWEPSNLTGTTTLHHLTTVDFSNNIFHDVLDKKSFKGLEYCKILYLNSCKISAIGPGTFDYLHRIEMLFLNNNFLVTVPDGLFSNILSFTYTRPRINLQDNMWDCNCSAKDLRRLVIKDMLLTDPVCKTPEQYVGISFTVFNSYCPNITDINSTVLNPIKTKPLAVPSEISGVVYVNNGCHNGTENSSSNVLKMMSPVHDYKCLDNIIFKSNMRRLSTRISSNAEGSPNNWIKFSFFIKSGSHWIVQITTTQADKYGLLWYQSTCPNEVYCVNKVPDNLRVYNMDMSAQYIFCPVILSSGDIEADECVNYNLSNIIHPELENRLSILLYVSTGGICLVLGAICVYALVRRHPNLLKGSKRILFVKHKTVDALVLPPKVPVRNDLVNEDSFKLNGKNIFVVSADLDGPVKLNRSKSTRSKISIAPSYISALQPTEDQLAEWRIRNHFTNDPTAELSAYSWICNQDSFHYTDVIDNDKTYESLK